MTEILLSLSALRNLRDWEFADSDLELDGWLVGGSGWREDGWKTERNMIAGWIG
jgi:hypothetical protein